MPWNSGDELGVSNASWPPGFLGRLESMCRIWGGSSGAALGLKAGISSMPPGEWPWGTHTLSSVSSRQR